VNGFPPITNWHIVISGYLQDRAQRTGMAHLGRSLMLKFSGRDDTRVSTLAWDDNMASMAEMVWRDSTRDDQTHICVYGYSWGGQSAIHLCRALQNRGLVVSHLVLCDPVYRHRYWLGQWRTLFQLVPIVIPENVREVDWVRQRVTWPSGHNLSAENADKTNIAEPIWLEVGHRWIDDHPRFQKLAMDAADA